LDWLETDDFDTFDEGLDSEYTESPFEEEDYDAEFYGESDDAESRASKRRRANVRARQAAQLRRRRQAQMARRRAGASARGRGRGAQGSRRLPAPSPEGREIQKTQEGIEKVDLENKVQADVFSRALNQHQRRLGRSEQAFALNKVIDEARTRLPDLFQDDAIKSAFNAVPLILLAPEKKRGGVEGLIMDPRVWSTLFIAGIALFARSRTQTVVKIRPETATIPAGSFDTVLSAFVTDKDGQPKSSQPTFTWTSLTPAVATVDSAGRVSRANGGSGAAIISATAENAQAGVATVIVEPMSP
jgi:hypothetical protein